MKDANSRSQIPSEPFSLHEGVRIHIPDKSDFDHEQHGQTGIVIDRFKDDGGSLPRARHELDDYQYTISLDERTTFTARHSDLRRE